MRPARGTLLVREIETSETLPGGRIVLPEQVRERFSAMQYECVSVGAPELCDDPDCERLHQGEPFSTDQPPHLHFWQEHALDSGIQAGAWVLTKPRVAIDTGIDGLYIIRQDDVVATFDDSPTVAAS